MSALETQPSLDFALSREERRDRGVLGDDKPLRLARRRVRGTRDNRRSRGTLGAPPSSDERKLQEYVDFKEGRSTPAPVEKEPEVAAPEEEEETVEAPSELAPTTENFGGVRERSSRSRKRRARDRLRTPLGGIGSSSGLAL